MNNNYEKFLLHKSIKSFNRSLRLGRPAWSNTEEGAEKLDSLFGTTSYPNFDLREDVVFQFRVDRYVYE